MRLQLWRVAASFSFGFTFVNATFGATRCLPHHSTLRSPVAHHRACHMKPNARRFPCTSSGALTGHAGSVAMAETLRALEPVTTVLFGLFWLGEDISNARQGGSERGAHVG